MGTRLGSNAKWASEQDEERKLHLQDRVPHAPLDEHGKPRPVVDLSLFDDAAGSKDDYGQRLP